MRKQRKMRGFTLVELLIVLLILGILIGLAVPRYLTALEQSRETTFCANVRSIISAMETYRMNQGTMEYPETVDQIIASPAYFSQPPINPYTGTIMTSTTASIVADEKNKGTFSYTRTDDKLDYVITTNPECGLKNVGTEPEDQGG